MPYAAFDSIRFHYENYGKGDPFFFNRTVVSFPQGVKR
jgi:hypothetical protein